MRFLLDHGFDVTPVNPLLAGQTLHGRTVVARLEDAAPLEMVDVFRNTSHASALVDEAIRLGAQQHLDAVGRGGSGGGVAGARGGAHGGDGSLPGDRGPRAGICSAADSEVAGDRTMLAIEPERPRCHIARSEDVTNDPEPMTHWGLA